MWLMFSIGSSAQAAPFKPGETITYTIKQLAFSAGEASLTYKGPVTLEGNPYILVLFEASGFQFQDKEEIYLEPETLLPMIVKREVDYLGKHEVITERYDHEAGTVKISKRVKGETTVETLEKPGPIDNIYGFIYRYRLNGSFEIGEELDITLPTMDLTMLVDSKETLKAAGEAFDSYYLKSDPDKYKLWFSATEEKIPLRISGAVGMANTTMIMNDYRPNGQTKTD